MTLHARTVAGLTGVTACYRPRAVGELVRNIARGGRRVLRLAQLWQHGLLEILRGLLGDVARDGACERRDHGHQHLRRDLVVRLLLAHWDPPSSPSLRDAIS